MQILQMTKMKMAKLVREIYMLILSEESMYTENYKMAQFMIDREVTTLKIEKMAQDDA